MQKNILHYFDLTFEETLRRHLTRSKCREFGEEAMETVIQGAKTFSIPMKNLKADLQAKKVIYNNNPIDKWCMSNTVIKRDENDNIRPVKPSNQRKRIDGTMSLLDAYVVFDKYKQDFVNMV